MNVERILIPTDLSEISNAALETADLFIDKFDCVVDLMHVIPLSKYLNDSFDTIGVPLDMTQDVYPKLIENQRKKLSAFANKHIKNKDRRGEYIINIDRKPSDSILKQIEKGNYDLVLMSAKGDHTADFFHGSATDKIIRRSETPVLTVTEMMRSTDINTIIVPCDFSDHSLSAIPLALDVAHRFGAKIQLLNVIELYAQDIHGIEPASLGIDEDAVYTGIKNRVKAYFEEHGNGTFKLEDGKEKYKDVFVVQRDEGVERIPCETIVRKSVAAHHEIVDYANEHADLLVMSTHGRSGLSRMLLGSTTEQVIQHLEIPQITVKPELEEEAKV